MTDEERERRAPVQAHLFSNPQLSWVARVYVFGDPTEEQHPPLKHREVLVRRLDGGGAGAIVLSASTFFSALLDSIGTYDIRRDGLMELASLYVKLFLCRLPASAETEVLLYSPSDIPPDPRRPVPPDVERQIRGPVTSWAYESDGHDGRVVFDGRIQFWDPITGDIGEAHFSLKHFLEAHEKSSYEVSTRQLAAEVGGYSGLR
jgi:hypothetical protein